MAGGFTLTCLPTADFSVEVSGDHWLRFSLRVELCLRIRAVFFPGELLSDLAFSDYAIDEKKVDKRDV